MHRAPDLLPMLERGGLAGVREGVEMFSVFADFGFAMGEPERAHGDACMAELLHGRYLDLLAG